MSAASAVSTKLADAASAVPTSLFVPLSDRAKHKVGEQGISYTQYQVLGGKAKADGTMQPYATLPVAGGKNPTQIRTAYELNNLVFGAVTGDGSGQTIAIVDAFDDPSFVSSTAANFASSDLARFDAQFGLADPPSFLKVNQTGGTTYPAYDAGWSGEIALDIEWAHVMAPKANIVLVEATNNFNSSLSAAVTYAKSIAGVTAVTMSFGGNESSSDPSTNGTYLTPAGHTGVTFFASTGDSGAPGGFPAYSPNVVAVGGTSLTLSGNNYSSESGWSGSGGGISTVEAKPAYQNLITTPSTTKRTIPDVSILANPNTGANILDTSAGGIGSTANWYVVGGTSLSSPMWAGLMAVTNQGRALEGLASLPGPSTLNRLYTLNATDYHDIVSGNNGFAAAAGYDLVTGRGTPRSSLLLPHLAGGVLSGSVFADSDADGSLDAGESGLGGLTVFADANNNGALDANESSATTSAAGAYILDVAGGFSYTLRVTGGLLSSYIATSNASGVATALINYGATAGFNFGLFPKSLTGSVLTARLDAAGTSLQVFTTADTSGTPTYSIAKSLLGSSALTFVATAAADLFALDLSNGNPIPDGGLSIAGGAVADTIAVLGSSTADAVTLNSGSLNFGGSSAITFGNAGAINVALNGGDDRLDVNALLLATTLTVDPGAGGDTIALGTAPNTTDAILGAIAIPAGTSDDSLLINESAASFGRTYLLSGAATGGTYDCTNTTGGAVTFGSGVHIELTPGAFNDTIDVTPSTAFSLNVIGDAATLTDNDQLIVRAAANSGFAFAPDATSESGQYTFGDGRGAIALSGIERNRPLAVTTAFDTHVIAPSVAIAYTKDVSASLSVDDLVITKVADGTPVTAAAVAYDPATNTARFDVSNLPDGDYHATLAAASVTDSAGNKMVLDASQDFFVLAGDINHDRSVDFSDLVILAQNYNTGGHTFAEGNLDSSADGMVDFADLVILAQHYNGTLPSLLQPAALLGGAFALTAGPEHKGRIAKGVVD